jgi:RNA 3'-terminal phosphate cyclase
LKTCRCPINIQVEYNETLSIGSGITLWAIFSKNKDEIDSQNPIRIGTDALGERGKKAEIVGIEAANILIEEIESRSTVDKFLADQILMYLALVKGRIKTSEITNHTKTNISTIERFLGKCFEVDKIENIISTIN